MRLTVFGGTGPTGIILVDQALAEGHKVTAYARAPEKLRPHTQLQVVAGELADGAAIAQAITGADAVISLLGPNTRRADSPPIVTGTHNIIAAMQASGVRRLVATATASVSVPEDSRDLRVAAMVAFIKRTQRVAYEAIVAVGEAVMSSDLEWTLARLPLLTDNPGNGRVNARYVGQKGPLRLSRNNAAHFLLEQLADRAWVCKAPLIGD